MSRKDQTIVGPSEIHGNGLFATTNFVAGAVVSECPVLIMSPDDTTTIAVTRLGAYTWNAGWNRAAVPLGNAAFINHDENPNAEAELDLDDNRLIIVALRDIKRGDEVCIDYQRNPEDD